MNSVPVGASCRGGVCALVLGNRPPLTDECVLDLMQKCCSFVFLIWLLNNQNHVFYTN